jgi:hypothetical protein
VKTISQKLRSWSEARRARRAKLPWHDLEAEAERQGCGPVDIFFDRAGRGPAEGGRLGGSARK